MPKMEAVPIKTKGEPWWKAVGNWMFADRQWKVVEDWYYRLPVPGNFVLVIRAGFIFDAASIPRIFWIFLSPTGLLLVPGLVHDNAYENGYLWVIEVEPEWEIYDAGEWVAVLASAPCHKWNAGAPRAFWDDLFRLVANDVNGMAPINRAAWLGIRAGGWLAWNEHRKKNKK